MKTDSNGLAVFLNAAQGVKARYHAPYAMPSLLAEAGKRAPKLRRAAARRTRNRVLAELAAVLIILAGCTIRIPASSSAVLRKFAPDIKPNVWQALSIFALSGVKINSQEELQFKVDTTAQEAYELYATNISARMLVSKKLPEDIRQSIGCNIAEDYLGPDLQRAKGHVGGTSQLGLQMAIDQAQFGWKFIRDRLTFIGEFPLDSKVKPFSELTPSEKALLAPYFTYQLYLGDEGKDHTSAFGGTTASLISAIAAYHTGHQITATDLTKAWVGPSAFEAAGDAAKAFTEEEAARWLERNFLIQVASPITGKPFEPNHREFSRGNGYVAEITNKEQIAKLKTVVISAGMLIGAFDYEPAPKSYNWSGLDKCRWCYFRLYGEDSVIAEGVLFTEWDGVYGTESYNIEHPSNTFTRTSFILPGVMYNPAFWSAEKRDSLSAVLDAGKQPAPDYEEWLESRTDDELAAIAWQLGYSPGGIFSTKEKKKFPYGKTAPKIESPDYVVLGSYNGLTPSDVNGLPTNDPIQKYQGSADERDYLLSSSLRGGTAPIRWFAKTGVNRITTPEEWCKLAYTKEQLREIIRAYATGVPNADRAKVKEFGPPYTMLGTDMFLPIYRDFEPYQGYFEGVDTPSLREKARAQLGKEPKDMIYFRIYGEERVIAEGVWVR